MKERAKFSQLYNTLFTHIGKTNPSPWQPFNDISNIFVYLSLMTICIKHFFSDHWFHKSKMQTLMTEVTLD